MKINIKLDNGMYTISNKAGLFFLLPYIGGCNFPKLNSIILISRGRINKCQNFFYYSTVVKINDKE